MKSAVYVQDGWITLICALLSLLCIVVFSGSFVRVSTSETSGCRFSVRIAIQGAKVVRSFLLYSESSGLYVWPPSTMMCIDQPV